MKNKKHAFRKNEEGAVAVLVALGMTLLFGFTALTVDFGIEASCKQSLQNAADAAALAGAADLGAKCSNSTIEATVKKYCISNGFDPEDEAISVNIKRLADDLTVTVSKTLPMGFSSVLTGERSRTVSASATAKCTSIFGACPYAMFAGQKIEDDGFGILMNGNNISINGNIHSNSDIDMKNAVLSAGHTATAVRRIEPANQEGWYKSIALDMPSYDSLGSALNSMSNRVIYNGSITKKKDDGFQSLIDDACSELAGADLSDGLIIEIHGNLIFQGNNSTVYEASFPIILIVDGDIDMNGSSLMSSQVFPATVISKNGNITVNGGGAKFTGIIYAPEGDVVLNGNDAEFDGSIIAKNIRKNGGKTTVTYTANLDRFLPDTKVFLIN